MSVQAGIWNFDGCFADRESLSMMGSAAKEYGPDGELMYVSGAFGLLYRPFHTTAESRHETQPYICENGNVITWDGRLDNRDELLAQLDVQLDADRSDVAIVAAGLARSGTEFFSRIIGDWALSLWDPSQQELVLARDYVGIRPLFYSLTAKKIAWSSHLSALVRGGDTLSLCDDYCKGYLTDYPEAHLTPYREIRAVPPASFIRFCEGQSSTSVYWSPNPQRRIRYRRDADYEDHFRALLRQSVRRRLRTDSPILAGLSGGFDSSSIVCMADDITRTENTHCPSIDTFSFCDRDEPDEDDFLYFTKVEERRGRAGYHAELQATGDSLSFSDAQLAAAPGFGERQELRLARSKAIAQGHYRVLLSGRGGDEFSGQALDLRVQLAELLVGCRLAKFGHCLTAWSLITRRPWIQLLFQTVLLLVPALSRHRVRWRAAAKPWINPHVLRETGGHSSAHQALRIPFWEPGLRDAVRTFESMARQMSCTPPSLQEVRYPFLDQTLTEFLTAIPLEQLLRPGQRRSLMRRALRDLLPEEVLCRQTKAGAGRCVTIAISKHWEVLQRVFDSPLSSALGYTDPLGLRQSFTAVRNGQITPYVIQLLRALSLEFWLRGAVERRVISLARSPVTAFTSVPQRDMQFHE